MKLKDLIFKIKLRKADAHQTAELYRDKLYFLGKNVRLHGPNLGTEPYLISIHDNVTCASNVSFVTHDVSCFNIARYLGIPESEVDKVGSIELFENCFVGAGATLMMNTSVGRNSIVAARSVVTKHIPDNEVWGGVPAVFICTTDDYAKKIIDTSKKYPWIKDKDTMSHEQLIKARQEYFFKKSK